MNKHLKSIPFTIGILVLCSLPAHANDNTSPPLPQGETFNPPENPRPPTDPRPPPRPEPPTDPRPPEPRPPAEPTPPADINQQLHNLVVSLDLRPFPAIPAEITGNNQNVQTAPIPILPTINDPKAQLGKQLFFAKNLGGEQSVACVSCHHPSLGGGDNLSLPVGINAVNELNQNSHDLLGKGRFNGSNLDNTPAVPRNSPTIFNIGLMTRGLFWDSRVETTRNGGIITPDSGTNAQGRRIPDANLPPGTTLAAAQARFPVTSADEMRGGFVPTEDNQALRASLAQRFNNSNNDFSSTWSAAFSQVYNGLEISFDLIADAIGEYERSMVFTQSPWNEYLAGDDNALNEQQKAGAVLFFTPARDGGAGCIACHSGPSFSDERQHLVAFPQIGNGKGNSSQTNTSQDFGRENVTNNSDDRYHFRTPGLLNIAATAPYGHSGAYQTLEQVVEHYNNPSRSIDRLFAARGNEPFTNGVAPFCQLPQIAELMQKNNQTCESIFPDAYANSVTVIDHLQQVRNGQIQASAPFRARVRLSRQQVQEVAEFLRTLTDPCVQSRECLAPWIIDENDVASFPDDLPLVAEDKFSNSL
ncbi:MAG: cytochrome C peroxidase [Alteromonadaceae bacterium]|nr:cytochrome C peroxidase [Alteromonadaceae bacterium]